MLRFLLLFLGSLSLLACQDQQSLKQKRKELDAGRLTEKNIYSVDEIGWSICIPGDWKIITKRETDRRNETGKDIIEEATGTEVNTSQLRQLLSFKKDGFNTFFSNMESFDESTDGSYDDQPGKILELLKQTYQAKNIPVEYGIGATRIDGIMFDRIELQVYAPGKKKKILTQLIFSTLIHDYLFSISINYTSKENEEVLMEALYSSKFDIENKN